MAFGDLPNELLLQIAIYLDPLEAVKLSLIAKRFLFLTQDNNFWRAKCYQDSRAAARRRREELLSQQPDSLAALARAVSDISGLPSSPSVGNSEAPNAEMQVYRLAVQEQARALANWDPAYPTEKVNCYQEYIHRHAPIRISWFETLSGRADGRDELPEATGAGALYDAEGRAEKLYAPLEDGSIAVWDSRHPETHESPQSSTQGRLIARSSRGFLTAHRAGGSIVRETGVVECVSIDSPQQRGFFAVENGLVQIDLNTLQIITRDNFVSPVNAISEAAHPTPLTIGTTHHLHLFDPRDRTRESLDPAPQIDHVGGPQRTSDMSQLINAPPPQYAVLSQPGPLSILHMPENRPWDGNGDIWVAGRFTHLLNYDRRFFPRLRGTVHSGARISCLTSLPYPYIPRERSLMQSNLLSATQVFDAKSVPGTTLIAAGEYKGKGSLELYGLSSEPEYTTISSDSFSSPGRHRFNMTGAGGSGNCAQNRQTASSSKLLSVSPHAQKIVYSDGDAKLKWIERDGFTPVREFSIDPLSDSRGFIDQGHEADPDLSIFASSADNSGDIVQKIISTLHHSILASNEYTPRLHEDNLIIWTGDGRLGTVGFGKQAGWREDAWLEQVEECVEEAERKGEERQYGQKMKEALQFQANEARFMSGLGLPFNRSF